MTANYNPALLYPPVHVDASATILRRDRNLLIEENRHIVETLAAQFAWRMRHRVAAERDDWKQEALKSLIRTVDLSSLGETQKPRSFSQLLDIFAFAKSSNISLFSGAISGLSVRFVALGKCLQHCANTSNSRNAHL
jgi:hypothetical protein